LAQGKIIKIMKKNIQRWMERNEIKISNAVMNLKTHKGRLKKNIESEDNKENNRM
jgi:hypothetical protein